MRGIKTFLLLLVLLFGPFISLGKYVEETSEKRANRDEAEETDDRDMEDEGEEEEYDGDKDQEDEQKQRAHIPEQSSEEPVQEEADDDDDDDDEFEEEEEEEVDNLQDDRMMDQDEGGMSLGSQMEEDVPDDQTGFEGFKRKVEEINKANEEMQAEINKLKMEFDKALSSDSNDDEQRSAPIHVRGTFISDSQKIIAI